MLLRVDTTSDETGATVVAAGEIDLATVDALRSALVQAVQAGSNHLTVNLNSVSYIDSAGLGALVGAYKRITAAGGRLTVRCSQPRVLRLFAMTGLTQLLTIESGDPQLDGSTDFPRQVRPEAEASGAAS